MFRVHRIGSNNLSVKNLILLFFTIILGFASVITLAQISIPSTIENARQTIGRITITSDGTNNGTRFFDFNYSGDGKTYINTIGLPTSSSFSGKVLGIDTNGDLIYVYSQNLVTSGGGGVGGSENVYWTGNGTDIYNSNIGNVGIGTQILSGKLHITSSAETELYLEENNVGKAANINFNNTANTWMMGGFEDRFYIGNNSVAFFNILTGGNVGIGTIGPKANLQVSGTFIAGEYSNTVDGSDSSIGGGSGNIINGTSDFSVIPGGQSNKIQNAANSFAGGFKAYAYDDNTFVRNADSTSTGFQSTAMQQFLINAPYSSRVGGVGININDPKVALDVKGLIRTRPDSLLQDCDLDRQGAIGFSGSNFYGCDGSVRKQLDN
ncbi:MAG: hypothetical protein WC606_00395 [Candidatus Absconditabacterales bacterium]